jgi:hypothetical protein
MNGKIASNSSCEKQLKKNTKKKKSKQILVKNSHSSIPPCPWQTIKQKDKRHFKLGNDL